jgi:hypothetical protein
LWGGKGVGGEEAAGDEFLGELDLAGGEVDGGGLGKSAVEEFVVEELVGDLGEAIGRQDGNGECEPVLGVIVVFWDRRGKALAEFHLGLEAGDTEVLGDVKVVEKDFLEGGLKFRGRVVSGAAKFFQHLLRGGLGVVGLAEPVKNKEELFLHLGRGAELVEGGGVKKFLQILFSDFNALELAHALGRGHGVEDQVVIRSHVVAPAKQVDVGVVVVLDQERNGSWWNGKKDEGEPPNDPQEKKLHYLRIARVRFLERGEITRRQEGLKVGGLESSFRKWTSPSSRQAIGNWTYSVAVSPPLPIRRG